jgi:hypothetical protein
MTPNNTRKRKQIKALVALAISLVAILLAPVVFGWGSGSTSHGFMRTVSSSYDASGSMSTFRGVIIITLVFYSLSFLTRWLVIPGLLTSLFGVLAIGTYMLAVVHNGGFGVILAPLVAFVGLIYTFFSGFGILRKPKPAALVAAPPDNETANNSVDSDKE